MHTPRYMRRHAPSDRAARARADHQTRRNALPRPLGAAVAGAAAALALAGPQRAGAQSPPPPAVASSAERAPGTYDGVTFPAEQRAAIRAAAASAAAEMQPILTRQTGGAPISAADRAALDAIVRRHAAAVDALLTPEQRSRVDANRRAQQERGAAAPAARGQP